MLKNRLNLPHLVSTLRSSIPVVATVALAMASPLLAPNAAVAQDAEALPNYAERATAIEVDAEVISVNQETRELVLQLPTGEQLTTVVDEAVQRLDEVQAGDLLVVTYLAALAAELREPTEEEIANPWIEGAEAGVSGAEMTPGGAMISAVRAVCTIEGMNRLLGTVMILDSRGRTHVIGDVKPERIESLRIGQSVVMTFTQALAVGIERPAG